MYLSLLLFMVPMILSNFSFEVVVIFAIFTINLFVKLLYEEKLLHRYFNNYDSYTEKTWRLIPLVF